MKIRILFILIAILSISIVFLLFSQVDCAMESDSLKEQIKLQREEMNFLKNITNKAISSCTMTIPDFESAVSANGRTVLWQGDDALVGPFRVKKAANCVVSISVVDGL